MSAIVSNLFRSSVLFGLIAGSLPEYRAASLSNPATESDFVQVVEVQPSKAKDVPAMRITLAPDLLKRTRSGYESTYRVTVFPLFFFNETGTIQIDVEPDTLRRLESGEVVSFTGTAVNHRGKERQVKGRAYPTDTLNGKIKLIVTVGGIELIFDTTYRFVGHQSESQRD